MLCICMQITLKNKRFKRVLCINVLYIDDVGKNALNLKIKPRKNKGKRMDTNRIIKATNHNYINVIYVNRI